MSEAAPELQPALENPDNDIPETCAADVRFEAAMARIRAVTGTRTQVELARLLGIRQSSISDAKRRASIPDAWLVRLFVFYDANPTWVLHGDGTPYLKPDTDRPAPDGAPRLEGSAEQEEPTPEPTVGELARQLEERLGGFLKLAAVPAGARVTYEMPPACGPVLVEMPPVMGKTGTMFGQQLAALRDAAGEEA